MPPPLTETERTNLAPHLMTLRIIILALAMGVASFAGVSLFLRLQAPAPEVADAHEDAHEDAPQGLPVLHLVACAFGVGAGVLAFLVPPFLRLPPQEAEKPDERDSAIQAAAQMVQTRTIIASALLEGAAFFNLIWFFLDGSLLNLAMAGLLLVLILLHVPLTGGYYQRIEKLLSVDPFAAKWQVR